MIENVLLHLTFQNGVTQNVKWKHRLLSQNKDFKSKFHTLRI